MAILNAKQLNLLKSRMERGTCPSNADILSIIETLDDMRKRKKRWQHIAEARGDALKTIQKLAQVRIEEGDV